MKTRKTLPKKKRTPNTTQSPLKEQVRALKRKLWVAERMRFEATRALPFSQGVGAWDGRLLAAGVAHEFNNILGAADGHAEWALESGRLEDMKEALEVVRVACQRSLQITRSLQGLPVLDEEATGVFSLSTLQSDLEKHFRPQARKQKVKLEVDLPSLEVYGRHAQLFEVLVNLVKNSFEALRGHPAPHVVVSGCERGKKIEIRIQDNGPGVPEALRERMFYPFFTTKGRLKEMWSQGSDPGEVSPGLGGGSGLGLFLSRGLVQAMGGRLDYKPSSQGACFSLTLPHASKAPARRSRS